MFVYKKEYEKLREEYEKLQQRAKLVDELEKECKRLADLISAEVKDCKVGAWCKDCKHFGEDKSYVIKRGRLFMTDEEAGNVRYCKKHLHEICPEFEMHT